MNTKKLMFKLLSQQLNPSYRVIFGLLFSRRLKTILNKNLLKKVVEIKNLFYDSQKITFELKHFFNS